MHASALNTPCSRPHTAQASHLGHQKVPIAPVVRDANAPTAESTGRKLIRKQRVRQPARDADTANPAASPMQGLRTHECPASVARHTEPAPVPQGPADAAGSLEHGSGAQPRPRPLVPLHAQNPSHLLGDSPLNTLADWSTRHVNGNTAATKGTVYSAWSVAGAGLGAGAVGSLSGLGEIGIPFAVAAVVCTLFESGFTCVTVKHARENYLTAHELLAFQNRQLAELDRRAEDNKPQPDDAAIRSVIERNIKALDTYTANYEKAYYRSAERPLAQEARQTMTAHARQIADLQAEHDRCAGEIQRLKQRLVSPELLKSEAGRREEAGIRRGIARIEAQQVRLVESSTTIRQQMATLHSRKAAKAKVKQEFAQAQAELERARRGEQGQKVAGLPTVQARMRKLQARRRKALCSLLLPQAPELLRQLERTQDSLSKEARFRLKNEDRLQVNQGAEERLMFALEKMDADQLPEDMQLALESAISQAWDALSTACEGMPVEGSIDPHQHPAWALKRGLDRTRKALEDANSQWQEALVATKDLEAIEQKVGALKQDLAHLDRPLSKIAMDPFEGMGHSDIKRLRSTYLFLAKSFVDLGVASTAASTVFEVLNLVQATLGLTVVGNSLAMGISLLDIKDAKHELRDALTAKLLSFDKATAAARLCQAYSGNDDPGLMACQYPVRALLNCASNDFQLQHGATAYSQQRKQKGTVGAVNAVFGLILAAVGLATGAYPLVIPASMITAGNMARYSKYLAQRTFSVRHAKDKSKANEAVTNAFVRRFGTDGIGRFYQDMAKGQVAPWRDELGALYQALCESDGGCPLDPRLFDPHVLVDNPWMAIDWMTPGIVERGREGGFNAPADLASNLARALGKTDPNTLDPRAYASAQEHEQAVRTLLTQIYGVKDYSENRLPLQDKRQLADIAEPVNEWIQWHFRGSEKLRAWIDEVARQPETFGEQLADLSEEDRGALRAQIAKVREALHKQNIGRRELRMLQALSLNKPDQDTPSELGAWPTLSSTNTPYLLELLADPSWLVLPGERETAAPPVEVSPGPALVKHLIKATKDVGRDIRDGSRVAKPRQPGRPGETAEEKYRRRGPRLERAAAAMKRRVKATAKHFHQHMPNPMATPAKAVEQLGKAGAKSDEALQVLLQNILLAFAAEVGGPDRVLKLDEDVMATLPDNATPTQVTLAHLKSLLKTAQDDASATAQLARKTMEPLPGKSNSRRRMEERMRDTAYLCATLRKHLHKPNAWEAILAPIQVQ